MAEFQERVGRQNVNERIADGFVKEGVFTGGYCLNPVTDRKIPIYAANFVLLEYGTGAVMAVPGHDQRDYDFAIKYELPIVEVVRPDKEEDRIVNTGLAWTGPGVLVNSGPFDGLDYETAKIKIGEHFAERDLGGPTISYRLRDWGISRQRYWGAPIPVIHCDKCGVVPVPESDLPVVLPENVEITGIGGSPLAQVADPSST